MYISYSVLSHGKAERHYEMGGDRAREAIAAFERLSGRKVVSFTFHKESGCWMSEVSRYYSPVDDNGDANFMK